jgi:hypothetical protein
MSLCLQRDADVTGRDSHGRWGSASRIRQLGRLNALTGCRRELAVIYGQARAGAIGWEDAARAADVLRLIASLVTAGAVVESDHRGGT